MSFETDSRPLSSRGRLTGLVAEWQNVNPEDSFFRSKVKGIPEIYGNLQEFNGNYFKVWYL